MRTLAEWLRLQESVHPKSIDLGLARVSRVAHALGVTTPGFVVITVGGVQSAAAMLPVM